ncbi:hypothetical protein ACQ4M4_11945 [Leptolyngbya sp. AN02str]|uniref:hypothetical protein n=1 Tax=Leptolyngbya sp. AN02str TaxID=3423363 RepID=UPI003D30FDE0
MNKPKFFVTPGYGEYMLNNLHYSQAVKIGDRENLGKVAGMTICKFLNRLWTKLLKRFGT